MKKKNSQTKLDKAPNSQTPATRRKNLATLADMWPMEVLQPEVPRTDKLAAPKTTARSTSTATSHRPSVPLPQDSKATTVKPNQVSCVSGMPKIGEDVQQIHNGTTKPRTGERAPVAKGKNANKLRFAAIINERLNDKMHRPIRINLGIDMGTSFTKVVWRSLEGTSYPVCFGRDSKALNDYLLPTIVAFDGFSLVTAADPAGLGESKPEHHISNFNICLACDKGSEGDCSLATCTLSTWHSCSASPLLAGREVDVVTAVFLGKLISRARLMVVKQLTSTGVRSANVDWSANLAVPEKFMNKSAILDGFEQVLKTAWLMADVFDEIPDLVKLPDLIDCYSSARELAEQDMNCFVYPEVGAQIACVTLPRAARDGLYAFVDIGAGTVDASVFRLHTPRNSAPSLHTYAAGVTKAGAAHIETSAGRSLARSVVACFRELKEGLVQPELASSRTVETLKPFLQKAITEVSLAAESGLRMVLGEAYGKEPNTDRWQDLSLVLGGGGAKISEYRDVARKAFKGYKLVEDLKESELPVPDDFERGGIRKGDFHRFAVAYGLSHRNIDLHDVALPDEVKPLPRVKRRRSMSANVPDDK
jgi:hypothetical protein